MASANPPDQSGEGVTGEGEALGIGRQRPQVDTREKQRLLNQLEKAADLLRADKMPPEEYAAIAVYNFMRLGRRIADAESLRGEELGLWSYLDDDVVNLLLERANNDVEASLAKFGPWNMAASWLSGILESDRQSIDDLFHFEWTEMADQMLERARLRLRWWPRLKFAWERRLERNREHFPHTTEQLQKAVIAFGSALAGGAVGAVLTWLVSGGG